MRTYTVHHIDNDPRTVVDWADETVFVKDGFCWPAFLIPMLWLIYRGMWWVLLGYFALVIATSALTNFLGVDDLTAVAVAFAVNLLMGFEGNDLLRWTLSRSGLKPIAVVQARSLTAAERRFFQGVIEAAGYPSPEMHLDVGSQEQPAPAKPAAPVNPTRAGGVWAEQAVEDEEERIVGLFPRPEGKA